MNDVVDDVAVSVTPWHAMMAADHRDWDLLLERLAAAPDLHRDWVSALVAAHEIPAGEIHVVRARDATGTRLIWPLRVHRERRYHLPVVVAEPLQSVYALHQAILGDLGTEAAIAVLMRAMQQHFANWTVLRLGKLVDGGPVATAWKRHADAAGHAARPVPGNLPPYLTMDCTWDEYLVRQSANFRANLKRKARKLAANAPFELEFIESPAAMQQAFGAISAIEARSWKSDAGTSLTVRPWEQRFYELLAASFAARGQILVSLLRINGQPVAYDLSLLGGGIAYCLKTSFDSDFRELSPGLVLRGELMKRLFGAGLREYDFLGHNERYKLEWATGVRQELTLHIINRASVRGRLLVSGDRLADWWRRRRQTVTAASNDQPSGDAIVDG